MKLKCLSILFSAQMVCAGTLVANPEIEAADQAFKNRGEHDFEQISTTRNLYKAVYDKGGLSLEERLKVATQIGRLDIFRAGLLPELRHVTQEQKIQAFDACLEDIENIADTNSAPYHYIKISCIAFRGKLEEGVLGRMKYGLKMRKAQGAALGLAESTQGSFEGGGIYRVMSAVRGNRKAKPLGLYSADEALTYASQATMAPANSDRYFEIDYSGADYYENYYYQAQANVAAGIELEGINLVEDARDLLKSKIKKITVLAGRDGGLKERRPETLAYQQVMKNLLGKIEGCSSKENWKSCLIEAL